MAGPVVFIHIPKTGGSTFLSVLRRNSPASDVLLPNALKQPETLQAAVRALSLDRVRSIHGHVPLSYLGDLDARFVTLLRDPVRRQYSHIRWIYGPAISVQEALAKERVIDNLQTRMLCGLDDPLRRPADDELLAAACSQVDRFAFVGIIERFAESMLLAQERLGVRHIAYRRRNVRGTSHAPEDVDALRAHNLLDLELYAHACALVGDDLDRLQPRAAALARADGAMSRLRPVADPAALGYVADYCVSVVGARIRRSLAWR